MDLVTRKKLLMRKYNNSIFTVQELDFFGRLNASEMIILLKENTHLRTSSVFFQHLPIRQLQKVISSVFQPEQGYLKSQVYNIIVIILKQSLSLIEICFSNEDFNYMSVFGFLQEPHINYPILVLLEDILLPYIRKIPFKIMEIITNDPHVTEILLNRIYEKPIFKIMYTVVFCLSKRHSQLYKQDIQNIIKQLILTPFTYLSHKQCRSEQVLQRKNQFGQQIGSQSKGKYVDSSQQLPQIHTKHVREKKPRLRGSEDSDQELSPRRNFSPIKKTAFKLSKCYSLMRTKSNRSISFKKINSRLSETSFHKQQAFPFNQDLDYADLTYNMKDLLTDLVFNIKSVYMKNVLTLLKNFNEEYIDSLLTNCIKYSMDQQYEGYCQGSIGILTEFGQLYKAVVKYAQEVPVPGNNTNNSTTQDQLDQFLKTLIIKLEKQLKIIASKIQLLCDCILQNNQVSYLYSSGQKLKRVGLVKYKIFGLVFKLLQLNSSNNSQVSQSFDLSIDFSKFDIFLIVQKYLSILKWNNLMHALIIKVIKLSLQEDYANFKKRYIQNTQMLKDGFMGSLIQLFRNKKFVFLTNLKFSNYGNLNVIYQIAKTITMEVSRNHDYELLVEKFPSFSVFVDKDLLEYQKNLCGSQFLEGQFEERQSHRISCIVPFEDGNGKVVNESMQKAQQILDQLQNAKRWTPNLWRNQKKTESLVQVQNFDPHLQKSVHKKSQ